jgi:hypothetical protein
MRSAKRKSAVVLMMSLLAGAECAVVANPAYAYIPPRIFGQVYNGLSPRCLDSGSPANAQLFNCSTSIYQQWTFSYPGGQIIGNSPTGCLDGGAGLNGTPVPMVPCTGSLSQRWVWDVAGGTYRIINQASGRCLEADPGTIGHNGTIVQLWDCNGQAYQQWYFQYYYPAVP